MLEVSLRKRLGDLDLAVDFTRPGSGVTALFGQSGAGKTSLVNLLAGLLRPDAGRVALDDWVLFDHRRGIDLPPEQRRVGYVFQDARLFPHFSVRGNLRYGLRLAPRGEAWAEFGPVVELLGIAHLLDRRPHNLSGGEKQRVAIGRALLTSPKLLLMDEPLASLDAPRKAEVLPYLARLAGSLAIPIVYVSHQPREILELADGVVLIEAGRVAGIKTREEFRQHLLDRPEEYWLAS